ncbi:hypothetical protein Tco_1083929, partial [Tanacetum coccineum]
MTDKEKKSTMKGFATNDQADYYSGITSITVNGKNAYELQGKFLDDLHINAFSRANGEDAVEHIDYFLRIVNPIDLPNVNQDKLRVVVFPISLASKFMNYKTMDIFTKGALWDYWKLRSDEIEPTNERTSNLEETNHDDEQEIDALKDIKLKEEALKNKAIMEGIINKDEESSNEGWRRWDDFDNTNHDNKSENEMEHEDEERCEVFDDHERPIYYIRRFEMVKYSFKDDEEYVAIKENEYDDLTNT